MPKARQTCTRCSMRRQKCDRKEPCTRCIRNNEASSCSRIWHDGYDPRIQRTYPKSKPVQASASTVPPTSNSNRILSEHKDPSIRIPATLLQIVSPSRDQAGGANEFQLPGPGNDLESSVLGTRASPNSSNCEHSIQLHPDVNISDHRDGSIPTRSDLCPRTIERSYVQTLLPNEMQILQLVEYHNAYLFWYHNCLHRPTFRMELNKALQSPDGLQLKHLDLRWCALLFAILAAALTCANDTLALSWGFSKDRKRVLSEKWYEATMSCLHLGNFTSRPHINSCQAIQILGMSAHISGHSNELFIIFGAASKIAQNLGLQRLALDPEVDNFTANDAEISQPRKEILIKRETGRSLWTHMCMQDWYSIPSSEMYFFHKQHMMTVKPHRIDDETLVLAGDQVPLAVDFCNHQFDVALLLAEFHDSITASADPTIKYEQVLKYDSKLRALQPGVLHPSFSEENSNTLRPLWARWAAEVAYIAQSHKIIMIHRSFLGKSFTDARYAYTRWASISASKTIVQRAKDVSTDVDMPALWNIQAHMVGAGITLCLDLVNRSEAEPEFVENRKLVEQAVFLLGKYDDSTLASRGVRLLSSLLKEAIAKQPPLKQHAGYEKSITMLSHEGESIGWPLENSRTIDAMWDPKPANSEDNGSQATAPKLQAGIQAANTTANLSSGNTSLHDDPIQSGNDFEFLNPDGTLSSTNVFADLPWTDLFSDYFPAQSGFENAFLIEDLFT